MASSYRPYFETIPVQKKYFIKTNFEYRPFCNSRYNSNDANVLTRICNTFIQALNEHAKLPKFLVIMLDADLIKYITFNGMGVSTIYGEWISWLLKELKSAIDTTKSQLPVKAKRDNYPVLYWVNAAIHPFFPDNNLHQKFNLCLESIIKQEPSMHVVKFKNHWSQDDNSLVNHVGTISEIRKNEYWRAVDTTIEFNVLKQEAFLKKQASKVMNGVLERPKPQEDEMSRFFKCHRNNRNNTSKRHAVNNRFLLPKLRH